MTATYQVSTPTDGLVWSQEMPSTAVTGHPYLTHVAALAIFNPTGSSRVVEVQSVGISPLVERTATVQTQMGVTRITAATGGDAITAVPLDSSNTALPSQVVVAGNPATITTSGTVISRVAITPQQNVVRALAGLRQSGGGRFDMGRLYGAQPHTDAQRITLREGQGVAVTMQDAAFTPVEIEWSVTFRVAATGATWTATGWDTTCTLPAFSLMNGSGSGVVLEIVNISVWEAGEDALPQFSIEAIDAINNGATLTPVSFDTTNTALGTVTARANTTVLSAGAKYGALIVTPRRRAVAGVAQGRGPGLAVMNIEGIAPVSVFASPASGLGMVVREGEGLAIIQRNTGKLGRFDLAMTFTVAEAASGAGVQPVVRAFA